MRTAPLWYISIGICAVDPIQSLKLRDVGERSIVCSYCNTIFGFACSLVNTHSNACSQLCISIKHHPSSALCTDLQY